jgi:hypothetical protein
MKQRTEIRLNKQLREDSELLYPQLGKESLTHFIEWLMQREVDKNEKLIKKLKARN